MNAMSRRSSTAHGNEPGTSPLAAMVKAEEKMEGWG